MTLPSTDDDDQTRQAPDAAPPEGPREDPTGAPRAREIGGPKGPEPTRYGDWERKGRCIDF